MVLYIKKYLKNVFATSKSICIVKMSIKIKSMIILNDLEFLLESLLYYCELNQ